MSLASGTSARIIGVGSATPTSTPGSPPPWRTPWRTPWTSTRTVTRRGQTCCFEYQIKCSLIDVLGAIKLFLVNKHIFKLSGIGTRNGTSIKKSLTFLKLGLTNSSYQLKRNLSHLVSEVNGNVQDNI